jgi:hypothetical protein
VASLGQPETNRGVNEQEDQTRYAESTTAAVLELAGLATHAVLTMLRANWRTFSESKSGELPRRALGEDQRIRQNGEQNGPSWEIRPVTSPEVQAEWGFGVVLLDIEPQVPHALNSTTLGVGEPEARQVLNTTTLAPLADPQAQQIPDSTTLVAVA